MRHDILALLSKISYDLVKVIHVQVMKANSKGKHLENIYIIIQQQRCTI